MSGVKVSDVLEDQIEVYTVKPSDTIDTILQTLTEKNILSAPVRNDAGEWIGIVDVLDILRYALDVAYRPIGSSRVSPVSQDLKHDDISQRLRRMHEFSFHTLTEAKIIDHSHRNPVATIAWTAAIEDAIEAMARPNHHRLIVVDDDLKPIHILTQSKVLQWINDNYAGLGEKFIQSVAELDLIAVKDSETDLFSPESPLLVVSENEITVDAYFKMVECGLSSVGVVEGGGSLKLIGNLSATDVKLLRHFDFEWLLWPVKKFLQEVQEEKLGGVTRRGRLIYVTPDVTLNGVVKKIVANKVHRVYIVNNEHDKKPLGVISLTDIAGFIQTRPR